MNAMTHVDQITSTGDLATHLRELEAERALAGLMGLDGNALYMDDLRDEIVTCRAAFVGAAVTEIAILRADLSAPLRG